MLNHIDLMDVGLHSTAGAQEVIAKITCRRIVTKLQLGHNSLNDTGGAVLFNFLASDIGRKYHIAEISLNYNGLADGTLGYIAKYLAGNNSLRTLHLQGNDFSGQPAFIAAFTEAVNASGLQCLNLSTNLRLSDSFAETFFPLLDAPRLRELQISSIDLHGESTPSIVEYISSPRCRLHIFSCNANNLGSEGVTEIVSAAHKFNYSLENLSLYANGTQDKLLESLIRNLILRNQHLKREVGGQALALLVYGRVLLLPTRTPGIWQTLPPELQLYILSFLAPTLSSSQHIPVCNFASARHTLPIVRLELPNLWSIKGGKCVPDPASLGFGLSAPNCLPGTCRRPAQTLSCLRDEERVKWLESVGCSAYELH